MCDRRKRGIEAELIKRKAEAIEEGKSPEKVEGMTDFLRQLIESSYRFSGESRSVTVNARDGGSVEGKSFSELATLPHIQDKVPDTFSLTAISGPHRLEVALKTWDNRALEGSVSGEDQAFAEELFGKLQDWVSDTRPKRWLQIWRSGRFFVGLLLYLWCLMSMIVFASTSASVPGPSIIRQQARDLARQGVTQANEDKAIELILALQSGYEPAELPVIHHYPPRRFYLYFSAGIFALVAGLIPPKGALGIWGGKRQLQRQLRWVRFVSVSVPLWVATTVVLPILLRLAGIPI
jgi:hypothetical protein